MFKLRKLLGMSHLYLVEDSQLIPIINSRLGDTLTIEVEGRLVYFNLENAKVEKYSLMLQTIFNGYRIVGDFCDFTILCDSGILTKSILPALPESRLG